jgi:peptidoglycan/xylan/chitin deacetylase (PgdA/CDA1 family)
MARSSSGRGLRYPRAVRAGGPPHAPRPRAPGARRAWPGGALVAALLTGVALAACGGSQGSSPGASQRRGAAQAHRAAAAGSSGAGSHGRAAGAAAGTAQAGASTGGEASAPARRSGAVAAPILMYHVINPPIAGAPYPGLYVSAEELEAQMRGLHEAGYHAVTLSQLAASWREGRPLPAKPVVLSFDNGYQSQYTHALPILRRYGWVGVENIQLSGLPPSQGGLSEEQVRGLIAAGWELDTQGDSHAELTALSPAELHFQVTVARQTLQRRYHVPVNWFCYPSGHYDAAVIAEVKAAGFLGSTTVIPGWASSTSDPYRLPRIRVLGGTSPQGLLALIAGTRGEPPPPPEYT